MCIHKSREFYHQDDYCDSDEEDFSDEIEYCDGSRFRCDVCHCRYPALELKTAKCFICNKTNFIITDVIEEEISKIYNNYRFETWFCGYDYERKIAARVWDRYEKEESNILSPKLKNYFRKKHSVFACECCYSQHKNRTFTNPISELKIYFKRITALEIIPVLEEN